MVLILKSSNKVMQTFVCKTDGERHWILCWTYRRTYNFKRIFWECKARQIAIDSILWNSEMEQWLDYWLPDDVQCQVLKKDYALTYQTVMNRIMILTWYVLYFQGVYQWNSKSQNRNIFASNFIPIWLNAYHHSGACCIFPCSASNFIPIWLANGIPKV